MLLLFHLDVNILPSREGSLFDTHGFLQVKLVLDVSLSQTVIFLFGLKKSYFFEDEELDFLGSEEIASSLLSVSTHNSVDIQM